MQRLILLLIPALLNAGAAKASGTESVQGWELRQKSGFVGDTVVELTATSIKILDRKSSLTVVSTAPKWDILLYNTSSKTKHLTSLAKFEGYKPLGFAMMMGLYISGVPLERKAGKSTLLDVQANIYGAPEKFKRRSREAFTSAPVDYKRESHKFFNPALHKDHGSIHDLEVLASSDWHLPKEEGMILARLYGISDIADIPLQVKSIDQDGGKKEALKTLSIKKSPIAASEFASPKDYRSVATVQEVRLDNSGHDGMEGWLQGLDEHLAK